MQNLSENVAKTTRSKYRDEVRIIQCPPCSSFQSAVQDIQDFEIVRQDPVTSDVVSIEAYSESSSKVATEEMPLKFQHIRQSIRKVRPEFYETIDKLKSSYHMSHEQAVGAVITVGNKMFGRKWKHHDEPEVIDLDTLPDPRNVRQAGKSIEAMALDEIVKEVMTSSEQVSVTYSEDGSKKQGAGSFSVQGITINGKYRALPTLKISSESRQNLADLKIAVLNILEAVSGVNTKDLFEKLDFVITDQTAHNFHVDEKVAEKLDSEHTPGHLFCNVHPSLMFNRVITLLIELSLI